MRGVLGVGLWALAGDGPRRIAREASMLLHAQVSWGAAARQAPTPMLRTAPCRRSTMAPPALQVAGGPGRESVTTGTNLTDRDSDMD